MTGEWRAEVTVSDKQHVLVGTSRHKLPANKRVGVCRRDNDEFGAQKSYVTYSLQFHHDQGRR
jgi:hypothetical protein